MFDLSLAEEAARESNASSRAGRRPAEIAATDGERLMRFRQHRDEAAFHEVVRAHAPLVWGICWQVLRHREDVEDAFQATFLILARKAASIRATESAAGWLYRVAFRTALAARQRRRRRGVEPLVDDPPGPLEEQLAAIERSEQCETLLEELHALATRYRQVLVLCYLEGRSRQEAADELGVTLATVKGRLARGLRLLRTRLAYRGLALSSAAALLAREMAAAHASVAAAPVAQAAALGASFAWAAPTVGVETSTVAGVAPGAITLANKGILAMKIAAIAKPAIGLLAVGVTAGALAIATANDSVGDGAEPSSTAVIDLVAGADAAPVGGETDLAPKSFIADAAALLADATPTTDAAVGATSSDLVAASPPGTLLPEPGPVAAPAAPAAEAAVGAPPLPTSDVLISADPAAPAVELIVDDVVAPAPVAIAAPILMNPPPQPAELAAPTSIRGPSRDVMTLEREYWVLKGRGLRRKAEALMIKAKSHDESGVGSRADTLEVYADAELTQAEAVLCDARAKQLEEALVHYEELMPTPATRFFPDYQPTLADPAAATTVDDLDSTPDPTPEPTPELNPLDRTHDVRERLLEAQAKHLDALAEKLAALERAKAELEKRLKELEETHAEQQPLR